MPHNHIWSSGCESTCYIPLPRKVSLFETKCSTSWIWRSRWHCFWIRSCLDPSKNASHHALQRLTVKIVKAFITFTVTHYHSIYLNPFSFLLLSMISPQSLPVCISPIRKCFQSIICWSLQTACSSKVKSCAISTYGYGRIRHESLVWMQYSISACIFLHTPLSVRVFWRSRFHWLFEESWCWSICVIVFPPCPCRWGTCQLSIN